MGAAMCPAQSTIRSEGTLDFFSAVLSPEHTSTNDEPFLRNCFDQSVTTLIHFPEPMANRSHSEPIDEHGNTSPRLVLHWAQWIYHHTASIHPLSCRSQRSEQSPGLRTQRLGSSGLFVALEMTGSKFISINIQRCFSNTPGLERECAECKFKSY
jgi:hypothetical protein